MKFETYVFYQANWHPNRLTEAIKIIEGVRVKLIEETMLVYESKLRLFAVI